MAPPRKYNLTVLKNGIQVTAEDATPREWWQSGRAAPGWLSAQWKTDRHGNRYLRVISANAGVSRRGIGRELYRRAAAYACQQGSELHSDDNRSVEAESFWRKQVARGYAKCIGGSLPRGSTRKSKCRRYVLFCPARRLAGR